MEKTTPFRPFNKCNQAFRKLLRTHCIILCLLSTTVLLGQQINIDANRQALNNLLEQLRDDYGLIFSYNHSDLAKYQISLKASYPSPEEAVAAILKDLPFACDYTNGVFIIYPDTKAAQQPPRKTYFLNGRILDEKNLEPLPFTHMNINNHSFISNENGYFSYQSTSDSLFQVQASYLGFQLLDTTLLACSQCNLHLTAARIDLPAVTIEKGILETASLTGPDAGHIKLNQAILNHLPGQSDNSFYNSLRLQPGILAAGEQSNDLIIWGCSEGESQVFVDQIPLWKLRNFNDHIGIINPLLIKNMELFKGGYSATEPDKVGGIIKINTKDGTPAKLRSDILISSLLANGLFEIPTSKRSSLKLGFRRTYYNLFDMQTETRPRPGNSRNESVDLVIDPDYRFTDMNLKFSGRTQSGDYFSLSAFRINDDLDYSFSNTERLRVQQESNENNIQQGLAATYEKVWKQKAATTLTLYHSELNGLTEKERSITNLRGTRLFSETHITQDENILEQGIKLDNKLFLMPKLQIDWGSQLIQNEATIRTDSATNSSFELPTEHGRIANYINNHIALTKHVKLRLGVRHNYSITQQKNYWAPRLQLEFTPASSWRMNASLSRYHQFVTRSVVSDESGNYYYIFICTDGDDHPVLEGLHALGNISYNHKSTHINVEGYYKTTQGISSYLSTPQRGNVFTGNSKSYGLDVLIKQNIGRHLAWIAYNLGKVEERYPDTPYDDYIPSPYDQLHELKTAGIVTIKNYYLSGNYIYGSGLPEYGRFVTRTIGEQPYHRMDLSFARKFSKANIGGEFGLTVYNITNYENFRLSDSENLPDDNEISAINLYLEPMPRTFSVFLKVGIR